jgi:uroporphyrinogen decarboxylase
MKNTRFLDACRSKPLDRPPVWMMRQAGRVIPEYQELREHMTFRELMESPERVAEVTTQPVDILGVDAAILFTDILIIPEAMGQTIRFTSSSGPTVEPLMRSSDQINALDQLHPDRDLTYVLKSIEATVERLDGRVPLIGFTGAPWTLACYMIEGGSSSRYCHAKGLLYDDPDAMDELLSRLTDAVITLLDAKIEAGIDAIQLFDTSASTLPPGPYTERILPHVRKITDHLSSREQPVIYYGKGTGHSLSSIVELGPDVIGLDWTVSMDNARETVPNDIALQGNLDPTVLLSNDDRIRQEVRRIIGEYGDAPGLIMNLGHGIYPETDVDQARAFVEAVQNSTSSGTA